MVVAALADGLGGHADGDHASRLAVEAALTYVRAAQENEPRVLAEAALHAAAAALRAARRETRSDLRTTLAVAALRSDLLGWAWSGDSRVYLLPAGGGAPRRLTVDHSLATTLADPADRAVLDTRSNPQRNTLISSLGEDDPIIESGVLALAPGDRVALCSDGFWEHADEAELFVASGDAIAVRAASAPFADDNATLVILARAALP